VRAPSALLIETLSAPFGHAAGPAGIGPWYWYQAAEHSGAVYDSALIVITSRFSMSDDIHAELERLRAENEALKKGGRGKLSMKVSEKGALSVYGMGRFPVTLYKEQWLRLIGMADDIKAFIDANNDRLKAKE
jgi:hypothetical protein